MPLGWESNTKYRVESVKLEGGGGGRPELGLGKPRAPHPRNTDLSQHTIWHWLYHYADGGCSVPSVTVCVAAAGGYMVEGGGGDG